VSVREPVLLSDEDLAYLEHLTRSRATRKDLHERATIVLLSHHGRSDSAIARELGIPRQKVIRTINRVLAIGVREGLQDLPGRGRPKTISPEARTWIVDLFCRKPVEFGYPHEVWTQRLLQQYVREHAIEEGFPEVAQISQGTISKFAGDNLKIANASAIKPHEIRSYVQNRDPEFHEKAIVVLHTYEEANILKVLEKCSRHVRIEVVADKDHFLCIGIVPLKKVLHLIRPILLGSGFGDGDPPPLPQRLGEHEPVDNPIFLVLGVVSFRAAGLCWNWLAHFVMQVYRLFIHADDRACWIKRALVDLQHILHRGNKVSVFLWRDDPLLFGVRLEHVF